MSIYSSLELDSDDGTKRTPMAYYGDVVGEPDVELDVAVGWEDIRLCGWPATEPSRFDEFEVLLTPDSAEVLALLLLQAAHVARTSRRNRELQERLRGSCPVCGQPGWTEPGHVCPERTEPYDGILSVLKPELGGPA